MHGRTHQLRLEITEVVMWLGLLVVCHGLLQRISSHQHIPHDQNRGLTLAATQHNRRQSYNTATPYGGLHRHSPNMSASMARMGNCLTWRLLRTFLNNMPALTGTRCNMAAITDTFQIWRRPRISLQHGGHSGTFWRNKQYTQNKLPNEWERVAE